MTLPDINMDKISSLNNNIGELQGWVLALLDALIKGDKDAMARQMELNNLLEGIILGLNIIAEPLREFRAEQKARDAAHASIEAQQGKILKALEAMNEQLETLEKISRLQAQQSDRLIQLLS